MRMQLTARGAQVLLVIGGTLIIAGLSGWRADYGLRDVDRVWVTLGALLLGGGWLSRRG